MAANITLEKFDPNMMDVNVYLKQFQAYCDAYYSVKAERRNSLFLANITHELFATLKDMLAPDTLQDQSFEGIQTLLKQHIGYHRNIMVERYRFHTLRQTELQSGADFLCILRRQIMKYDFGPQTDNLLRDQIVVGVFREDVRRRLLANEKLSLQGAIDLLTLEEEVENDARYFHKIIRGV